ncbi:gamma-glutamyl hydrolase 2-like [Papaver somniferum]|uniref:gamma-glutamyl hydrolase 2-like n=1 Tax=Papaver somniferum TaxID=3469 RepID=UPI000E6F5CCC|nr:gamma-glutamyl hydrolase 2-like [Papaver somniferum]
MHARFLCNSSADYSENRNETESSSHQNSSSLSLLAASSSSPSSSSSSSSALNSRYTELVMNYLWVPLLISLTNCLNSVKAAHQTIRFPVDDENSVVRSGGSCIAPDSSLYYRPVIGILTHPGDGASGRLNNDKNASYIAASYVKFIESAGARVIPLIYNEPEEVLYEKLNLVNGVLFTGGWAKTGLYYEVVEGIFKRVLKRNNAGDHFPLLAICLGFELLSKVISKDPDILEKFSAQDHASTLQFIKPTNIEGTVFQRFPPELLQKLTTDCLAMQNHQYGVSPERFQENSALCSFFRVVTTCTDEDNQKYVSTVQAHDYPITGVQWHPEKNAFEWGYSTIPHSEDAIQVTQHVANYFISEARKSLNRPPTRKVLDNLIYNYNPTFCGKAGRGFDEVYIFSRM